PAISLALTSLFAFSGDLNLLRRILAIGTPRNVVVMHTADDALARESPEANLMTEDPTEISAVERLRLWWRLCANPEAAPGGFHPLAKWGGWEPRRRLSFGPGAAGDRRRLRGAGAALLLARSAGADAPPAGDCAGPVPVSRAARRLVPRPRRQL